MKREARARVLNLSHTWSQSSGEKEKGEEKEEDKEEEDKRSKEKREKRAPK